jgi:hypothetical protein
MLSVQEQAAGVVQTLCCLLTCAQQLLTALHCASLSTACSINAEPESVVTPGTAITVSTKLRPNQAPVASATLLLRVNYAPEQELPMTAGGRGAGTWSGYTEAGLHSCLMKETFPELRAVYSGHHSKRLQLTADCMQLVIWCWCTAASR